MVNSLHFSLHSPYPAQLWTNSRRLSTTARPRTRFRSRATASSTPSAQVPPLARHPTSRDASRTPIAAARRQVGAGSRCATNTTLRFLLISHSHTSIGGAPHLSRVGAAAGSALVASGYCLYSSSCMFVFTVGAGTHGFTLDPLSGNFVLTHPDIQVRRVPSITGPRRWSRRVLCGSLSRALRRRSPLPPCVERSIAWRCVRNA